MTQGGQRPRGLLEEEMMTWLCAALHAGPGCGTMQVSVAVVVLVVDADVVVAVAVVVAVDTGEAEVGHSLGADAVAGGLGSGRLHAGEGWHHGDVLLCHLDDAHGSSLALQSRRT